MGLAPPWTASKNCDLIPPVDQPSEKPNRDFVRSDPVGSTQIVEHPFIQHQAVTRHLHLPEVSASDLHEVADICQFRFDEAPQTALDLTVLLNYLAFEVGLHRVFLGEITGKIARLQF